MTATRSALAAGIRAAVPGASLRNVGAAVERTARDRGYRVFRELTGHGIGRAMHEPPTVFNWAAPEATGCLRAGQVFTIEPMLTAGHRRLVAEADGWTLTAVDGSPSAHEEHTIVVAHGGPVILTRG